MANGGNRFPRVLLVLAIVIFKGVTSNINDGSFDEDENDIGLKAFLPFYNQFYDAPLHPVENHLWRNPENLGEVSGVAVEPTGNVLIFHRGDRTWDYDTFNEDAVYQEIYRGPIRDNTVLTLDSQTGDIIRGWGNQTFYLPHGIHVDPFGNIWLTDIALHQVFKYSASGVLQMVLGQKFKPGSSRKQFCQPTSVAVFPSGEIVVADGYCNDRLILFNEKGNPMIVWGLYDVDEEWRALRIPHALTILPNKHVCIADRENWRIVCMEFSSFSNRNLPVTPYSIRHQQFGRIFGIASYRGFIYAVNGVTSENIPITGFTIDPINQNVTGFWGPESSFFQMPHAIAVCPFGKALYVSEIGPNKIWKFDLVTKSN